MPMIRFFSAERRNGSTRRLLDRRSSLAASQQPRSDRPVTALNEAACRLRRRCEDDLAHFLAQSSPIHTIKA
jgi:hypothetical protein